MIQMGDPTGRLPDQSMLFLPHLACLNNNKDASIDRADGCQNAAGTGRGGESIYGGKFEVKQDVLSLNEPVQMRMPAFRDM